jgi:hypothetical protein
MAVRVKHIDLVNCFYLYLEIRSLSDDKGSGFSGLHVLMEDETTHFLRNHVLYGVQKIKLSR